MTFFSVQAKHFDLRDLSTSFTQVTNIRFRVRTINKEEKARIFTKRIQSHLKIINFSTETLEL